MFNARQLLVHSLLLRAITAAGKSDVAEFVLGSFQQYLRNQCLFTIWNVAADKLEPHMSHNNYHPKSTIVENSVFANLGRGNWNSQYEILERTLDWTQEPYEIVDNGHLASKLPHLSRSAKVLTHTTAGNAGKKRVRRRQCDITFADLLRQTPLRW
jgi:hypothetical protein